MFDFHTHILPGIDDGSRSVEESLEMVEELTRQGVSGIAATPHFYAACSTPENFFLKREAAWKQLEPNLPSETAEIRLGAEVQYFEGIHRMEGLERFCLEGTKLLMIEMPVCKWTSRMISSIQEINSRDTITVLLAHIERYQNGKVMEQLQKEGVLMQASTGFFIRKRHTALRMLKNGRIHLLGTDSHNMDQRKPDFARAMEIINRKMDTQILQELAQMEVMVLDEMEKELDYM